VTVRRRLPRLSPLLVAGLAVLVLALGGGWLWLRSSSVVAVKRVTVVGATGPDAKQIRAALTSAAQDMTTLDVQVSKLRLAVAPFPIVKNLEVSTLFPHGIRIRVIEQVAVATLSAGGQRISVSRDGTLLRDTAPTPSLPTISVPVLPGGARLTDPTALGDVAVLAAAPYALLDRVQTIGSSSAHGITVRLRNGPSLYFGDSALLGAKWMSAAGVLADPGSQGASYIDVTDPQRPAAGATASAVTSAATAAVTTTPGD
jgi:cell division protein FtsQ